MNYLIWSAQIILAGVFLYSGFSDAFASERQMSGPHTLASLHWVGLSKGLVILLALIEISAALGLLVPAQIWGPEVLPRLAAGVLALVTAAACVYHGRRKEHTAPMVALFFIALLVIVGRWP
jgi:uncharacterized membrane protein YphA (DoxX/SURF4 family)